MKSGIRHWHWGKIVMLWAWGGLIVALLLSAFLSQKADVDVGLSSVTLVGSLVILVALSIVTWIWLGGKDRSPASRD